MIRTFELFEAEDKKHPGEPAPYSQDHPINENRILRAEEQLRELRATKGRTSRNCTRPGEDKLAAEKNGIDYPALLLSTKMPTPAAIMASSGAKHQ